jgi:NADPH-dependent curcumin reductase CurA
MANETNLSYIINERPSGEIVPGRTFTAKTGPAPKAEDLEAGKILVETLYLSLDPGFRTLLNEDSPFNLFGVGDVMVGGILGRVLASCSENYKTGDLIETSFGRWQEYSILDGGSVRLIPEVPAGSSLVDILGVLGGTGLTAYFGIEKMAAIQQADTVVVSGAAGATGIVVGQLARVKGAKKVVGIAGSDEKCKWLVDEIGYDAAVNYKALDFKEKLTDATDSSINVYWDNGEWKSLGAF